MTKNARRLKGMKRVIDKDGSRSDRPTWRSISQSEKSIAKHDNRGGKIVGNHAYDWLTYHMKLPKIVIKINIIEYICEIEYQ